MRVQRSAAWLPLLLLAALASSARAADTRDGLSILEEMSRHYAQAQSWRLAGTREFSANSTYSRNWARSVLDAAQSGDHFRYEGRGPAGSALHISNGKILWTVHPDQRKYTEAPVGTDTSQILPEESAAHEAAELRKEYADFAGHYGSATRLPDETLRQDGGTFRCYVVRVTSKDSRGTKGPSQSAVRTLWIDQATFAVRKEVDHMTQARTVGLGMPGTTDVLTVFMDAELNAPLPESLFTFTPTSGMTRRARFTANLMGVDLTGDPAPQVALTRGDGSHVPLASYRPKPVLLDIWATWCGPCVAALPTLARLEAEAAPKGLAVVSVDEDEDAKSGAAFFTRNNYPWAEFHDDGTVADAFQRVAIPLVILIDTQGKIAYYGSGQDEAELRNAIADLGPEFGSLRLAPKPAADPAH